MRRRGARGGEGGEVRTLSQLQDINVVQIYNYNVTAYVSYQVVHPQKRRVLRHLLDGIMGR